MSKRIFNIFSFFSGAGFFLTSTMRHPCARIRESEANPRLVA